ncbi:MAG: SDR family NAD(P)-dependent oxidoreductase [Gemmatimonadota bacterium]
MSESSSELSPLKRSLLAIEQLQARIRELESDRAEAVAVIGAGCRLPGGVVDPDSFWELLRSGTDAVLPAPPVTRPTWGDTDPTELPPAGYLDVDVGAFDPVFFGISPREAAGMDPQQRLSLECAWEALEDACIDPRSLEGSRTGVFMGVTANEYAQAQTASSRALQLLDSHFTSGIAHSMVSGRLSYLLGLQGPSLRIDTACSSSLVSLHLAAQSLASGESDLAVVGGVNLILTADYTRAFQRSRMLAPDGRCKTFSDTADGFGRGEGCAVVVLKRLSDAIRDGDPIRAVVRGTAVNQDGPSSGLTAPNGPAQEAVIRSALTRAGLEAADVDYVEAHGTGTELGDPIEVQALGRAYGVGRATDRPLLVGSAKTNFGHLEAAAGIVGFLKAVLCTEHGEVPPHLHIGTPSPHIPWDSLPLRVVSGHETPELPDGRLRAGVSSFGFSGTNAHVILESWSGAEDTRAPSKRQGYLLPLAAATRTGLDQLVDRWADHLNAPAGSDGELSDPCHTAAVGRAPLAHRAVYAAATRDELAHNLRASAEAAGGVRAARGYVVDDEPRLAFLFTGQGAQFAGMGAALIEHEPVFAEALRHACGLASAHLDFDLFDAFDAGSSVAARIDQTDVTQPALFCFQYALIELWRHWGVRPDVVAGHSIGEYAAACAAGVLSVEDAARLVAHRGRLMHAVDRPGRMVVVSCDEDAARILLDGYLDVVSVAALNAPDQIVLSGASDAMNVVEERAEARGIRAKALRTSQAFHSPLMDEVVEGMRRELEGTPLGEPKGCRFVSTVSGRGVEDGVLTDPEYWAGQVRAPVDFARACAEVSNVVDLAVEIGPRPVLSGLMAANGSDLATVPSQRGGDSDGLLDALLAAGTVWAGGASPRWDTLQPGRRVRIPTTPFDRSTLWVDLGAGGGRSDTAAHPILGRHMPTPRSGRSYQAQLAANRPEFIGEHVVGGAAVLPGTAYLSAALAAGRDLFDHPRLSDVDLLAPMRFGDEERLVHSEVSVGRDDAVFELSSSPVSTDDPHAGAWTVHAQATIRAGAPLTGRAELAPIRARCATEVNAPDFYADMSARGYPFGARLRTVHALRVGEGEALGELRLTTASADDADSFDVHPLLLDGALQVAGAAFDEDARTRSFLPFSIGHVQAGELSGTVVAHATASNGADGRTVKARVDLYDPDGRAIGSIEDVVFREVDLQHGDDATLFELAWTPVSVAPTLDTLVGRTSDRVLDLAGPETARYDAFVDDLEDRSAAWVEAAFSSLGWTPSVGDSIDPPALFASLGVHETKQRLFDRCIEMLTESGCLMAADGGWSVARPPRADGPPPSTADDPESRLVERCGPALAGTLRGEVDPLAILFPADDNDDAKQMYRDAPFARLFGGALAELVCTLAEGRSAERPLRILEVGGGTGGVTSRIVPALTERGLGSKVEYTFTDVSPYFTTRADEEFGSHGFVRFEVYDLDTDPVEQGFDASSFDVVVAASCIHAARDLDTALRGISTVLADGGTLLAVEVFGRHRWFDVTVGLTDSWWHYTDEARRGNYPCPGPDVWHTTLSDAGFGGSTAVDLASILPGPHGVASRNQGFVFARKGATAADAPWLVVSEPEGLGTAVLAELSARGHTGQLTTIDGAATALTQHGAWAGAVLLDTRTDERVDPLPTSLSALDLVRALRAPDTRVDSFLVVTRGSQVTRPHDTDVDPIAASLWGLSRTVAHEAPELAPRRLDLEATRSPTDASTVVEWLLGSVGAQDVAVRGGQSLTPSLVEFGSAAVTELPEGYRLGFDARGAIANLRFAPAEREELQDHEVRIRVAASAMNFKDVLNVLDMYPGDPGPLGSESAGVVVEAGSASRFQPGDRVLAIAGGAYAEEVVADDRLVAHAPPHLSFSEAATLPIAYLTAQVALSHFGSLEPGDRVLIHAATGGVGTAARAIASAVGAEIFATAGTPEKRAMLKDEGVEHVFDSRSASFADGVLDATDGGGVAVVLNSLADELIDASFRVTARGARFLEIGKRGIWSDAQVDALEKDIAYHVIDWGAMFVEDPELVTRLFDEVVRGVTDGALPPLRSTRYPIEDIESAFRFMAAGHHVGKVVAEHPVRRRPVSIEAGSSYVVTGGTSGLGLVTARWLAERGAGHVMLLGRREPTAEAASEIESIRTLGADVTVRSADVGDLDALRDALADGADDRPIRGVVHAAGTLSNGTLESLTEADFAAVNRSKVEGTGHLLDRSVLPELDFIVGYSSIAGLFGSPGQANHAAANTYMDAAIASAWGRTSGRSIAWGRWSDTGSATGDEAATRNESAGMGALSNSEGLASLEQAGSSPRAYVVGTRIDRPDTLRATPMGHVADRLTHSTEARPAPTSGSSSAVSSPGLGLDDVPAASRAAVLGDFVRQQVAQILGVADPHSIESRQSLGELGMDSLLAVELRNVLGEAIGTRLPSTLLFDYPTLATLTDFLTTELTADAPTQPDPAPAEAEDALDAVDALSDEEVERLLAEKFGHDD